jgi:peptidoglycan/xylan/chitin deacetylase (PgdA/CDA1 family)
MKPDSLVLLTLFMIVVTACSGTPNGPLNAPPTQIIKFEHTVVSLTFDDGDADNYNIRRVLTQNNLHATFFIVSGFIGTPGYMTAEQLQSLYADGNEIGGHSLSHIEVTNVRVAELRREICQDRLNLHNLGFSAASFAYPFGHYNEEARQVVMECGYNSARTVTGGPDSIPPDDPYFIKAMPYIVSNVRLSKMIRYITATEKGGGGWVIFIFHHVCNNCDQYSVDLETFSGFAYWLKESQANGLVIKTVGEVIGGQVKPGVEP